MSLEAENARFMPGPYMSKPYQASPLLQLIDGFFNPDWRLDYPSEAAVVDAYRNAADEGDLATVVDDIDEVLAQWKYPAVRTLLGRHLEDVPVPEDRANQWLDWLRSRLVAGAEKRMPPPVGGD